MSLLDFTPRSKGELLSLKKSDKQYKVAEKAHRLNYESGASLQQGLSDLNDAQLENIDGNWYDLEGNQYEGEVRNLYIDNTADNNYKLGLARSDVNPEFISPFTGKPITPFEARYLDKKGVYNVYQGNGGNYDGTPGPEGVTPRDGALLDITVPYDVATDYEYRVNANAGQILNRAMGIGPKTPETKARFGSGQTEYTTPNAPLWNQDAEIPTGPKQILNAELPRDAYESGKVLSANYPRQALQQAALQHQNEITGRVEAIDNSFMAAVQHGGVDLAKNTAKFLDSITGENVDIGAIEYLRAKEEEIGYESPYKLEVTKKMWEELGDDSTAKDWMAFAGQAMGNAFYSIGESAAYMVATRNPIGMIIGAMAISNDLAEGRAENLGTEATWEDKLAMTPFGAVSMLMEKVGVDTAIVKAFNKAVAGKNINKAIAIVAGTAGESVTEGFQSGLETIAKEYSTPKWQGAVKVLEDAGWGAFIGGLAGGQMTTASVAAGSVVPSRDKLSPKQQEIIDSVKAGQEKPVKDIVSEVEKKQYKDVDSEVADLEDAFLATMDMKEGPNRQAEIERIRKELITISEKRDVADLNLNSEQDAEDAIAEIYMVLGSEAESEVLSNRVTDIAKKFNISYERLQEIKNEAAVEIEATDSKGGYKTYGRIIRKLQKNPELYQEQIDKFTSKLVNFEESQQEWVDRVEGKIAEIQANQKSGVQSKTQEVVELRAGNKWKININKDGSIGQDTLRILEKKKQNIAGIQAEYQKSGLDIASRIMIPKHADSNKNKYRIKDEKKFRKANKLIAFGHKGTSTEAYQNANKAVANTGKYTKDDVVGVSVSGMHWMQKNGEYKKVKHTESSFRSSFYGGKDSKEAQLRAEIDKAIEAKATIVADTKANRERTYNKHTEGEIAKYLLQKGYVETELGNGVWKPKKVKKSKKKETEEPKKETPTKAEEKNKKEKKEVVYGEKAKEARDIQSKIADKKENLKKVLSETKKARKLAKERRKAGKDTAKLEENIGLAEALIEKRKEEISSLQKDLSEYKTTTATQKVLDTTGSKGLKSKMHEVDITNIVEVKDISNSLIATAAPTELGETITDYTEQAVEILENVIAEYSSAKEQYYHQDSPSRGLLFDADGMINETTAAALATASIEYIATMSGNLGFKTIDDVARQLGRASSSQVQYSEYTLLRDKGLYADLVASNIGANTLKLMGLKIKKDIPIELHKKLVADLGNVGVRYLIETGVVEENTELTINEHNKATGKPLVPSVPAKELKKGQVQPGDNPIYMIKLVNMDYSDVEAFKVVYDSIKEEISLDESYSAAPKRKPVETTDRTTRGVDVVEQSDEAKQVLDKARNQKFITVDKTVNWLRENRDTALKKLGYKVNTANMSYAEALSVEAKNQQIVKSLDAINDVIDDYPDGMYFDWYYMKNGRYGIDSTTINPQSDKLHRFITVPEQHEVTIPTADKDGNYIDELYIALAQAAGIETKSDGSIEIGLGTDKISTKEVIAKGKEVAQKDPNELLEMLENDKVEVEHLSHFLQAVWTIENMQKANGSEFETNLSAEFDAVTSGFAIKIMQYPIPRIVDKWSEKVGIFTDREVESMNDEVVKDDFFDSYETLAIDTKKDKVKVEDLVDTVTTGSGDYKKADTNIKKVPDIAKQIIKGLPTMENGKISKALRTLFKDPFMTFNYSRGLNTLKQSIGYNLAEEAINDMAKEKRIELLGYLQATYGTGLLDKLRDTDPTKIRPTSGEGKDLFSLLADMYAEAYGTQAAEILEKEFTEYIYINKKVNQVFRGMFNIFDKKFTEAKNKMDRALNPEEELDLINEYLADFPLLKGPMSTEDLKSFIPVYDQEVVNPKELKYSQAATHLKDADRERFRKTVASRIKQFKAAWSAGAVTPIHYIDAAMIGRTFLKNDGLQLIHDAIIPPITKAREAVKDYNTEYHETNKNYSIMQELTSGLEKILEDKESRAVEIGTGDWDNGKEIMTTMGEVLEEVQTLNKEIQSHRARFYEVPHQYVQMSAMPGSDYKSGDIVTKEATKVEENMPEATDTAVEALVTLIKTSKGAVNARYVKMAAKYGFDIKDC